MAKKKKKKETKRKERDLVKINTLKRYIVEVLNMRISKSAADDTRGTFNALLKSTLAEAKRNAKADKRSTIMPQDMTAAIDKTISKKNLEPDDLAKEINRLSAVDIGNLVNQIDIIIEKKRRRKIKR